MNYFPFHLGDYAAHTAHLEPMEDLAYRRLLDQYYLRECPLPADIQQTAKLVRMRSMVADVESVLNEFFILTAAGWMHTRCEQEIEHMQDKQKKARASAAASVKSRQAFAAKNLKTSETDAYEGSNGRSTDVQNNLTDAELPTPTPTPTPIPITAKAVVERVPRKKALAALPDDFAPNENGIVKANERGVDASTELEKFRNYHQAKASLMADWQAAWRTWVGNARPSTSPLLQNGIKRGSDEYAKLHKTAAWWADAGFDNVWNAMSAGCYHDTANRFSDGKKLHLVAA